MARCAAAGPWNALLDESLPKFLVVPIKLCDSACCGSLGGPWVVK